MLTKTKKLSTRPRAFGLVVVLLPLLAASTLTLFVLTRGVETSTWVITDAPRARLLGMDSRAKVLARAAGSDNPAAYLDEAAADIDDGHRFDPDWVVDVNDAYGIATITNGGTCEQLISGPVDAPGSVVPCLDDQDRSTPVVDDVRVDSAGPGAVTVNATVTDNRSVIGVMVDFRSSGMPIGESVQAERQRWTRTWLTPATVVPSGADTLCVTATDEWQNASASACSALPH